jgi:hypothetical protein
MVQVMLRSSLSFWSITSDQHCGRPKAVWVVPRKKVTSMSRSGHWSPDSCSILNTSTGAIWNFWDLAFSLLCPSSRWGTSSVSGAMRPCERQEEQQNICLWTWHRSKYLLHSQFFGHYSKLASPPTTWGVTQSLSLLFRCHSSQTLWRA